MIIRIYFKKFSKNNKKKFRNSKKSIHKKVEKKYVLAMKKPRQQRRLLRQCY